MEEQTPVVDENVSTNQGDTSTVNEGVETYTQQQVNKIVSKRVNEVKKQFADYEQLKEQVEQLQTKIKLITDDKKAVEAKYTETVYNTMLTNAATELGLDPELASKLLERDKIIVADEKPSNLKELLQAVIEKHPNLVKKAVVTPVTTPVQSETPKFSLHNSPNTSKFFNGGGLRLNHLNTKE